MNPQVIKLPPTYIKESGLWSLNTKPESIKLPQQNITFTESSLVNIPPHQIGGNHKHPRIELFAALAKGLELVWIDDQAKTRSLLMLANHDHELTLYLIPASVPHAVHNSSRESIFLVEFASEPQHDVESIQTV